MSLTCKKCNNKATHIIKKDRHNEWIVAYPKVLPIYCLWCAIDESMARNAGERK